MNLPSASKLLDLVKIDTQNTTGLNEIRASILLKSLLKKYVEPTDRTKLHGEALDSFVRRNESMSNMDFSSLKRSPILPVWQRILYDALMDGPFQTLPVTLHSIVANGHCGPGASNGSQYTDFYCKMFESPLAATSFDLHRIYAEALPDAWVWAELSRSNTYGYGSVLGSQITSVPKDSTRNRVICIEPTLNMFFQLGVKDYLESVLKYSFGINLATQQDWNKHLAKQSSIDNSLATLDLKDASDSISIELLTLILPQPLLNILLAVRSPFGEVQGKQVKLNMISTMGNGFTFPLMTLIFAALMKALGEFLNYPLNKLNTAVFGDDIICPSSLAPYLISMLSASGFTVNPDKSFTEGPFRESCGGDYYLGHDVRGVYLKELINEPQVYSAFNRLHSWSLRFDIPLYRSLRYLLDCAKFRPVPRHAGYDEGFILPSEHLLSPKRDRNGSLYYYSSRNAPLKRRIDGPNSNPWGILIGCLGGLNGDKRAPLRGARPTVCKKLTPHWDYTLTPGFERTRDLVRNFSILLSIA